MPRHRPELCDACAVRRAWHNQTSAKTAGLHLHTAVDDAGLPLGLLKLEFDAPQPSKNKLLEERKSGLRGLRAEAARRLDGTQQRAGKRTSCSPNSGVSAIILVRAKHSRKLSKTEKLFDSVRAAPGRRKLVISRLSQRPRVSKRKATDGRKERVAEIRSVLLPPGGTAPLPVVRVSEPEPRHQTGGSCGRRFSKTQCGSSTGTL